MDKKKKRLVMFALIVLIILLATGFTFSKYVQNLEGSIAFQVAPWKFNVTTNQGKPLSEVNLLNPDGTQIGPGSEGSFEINLDASGSGVDMTYAANAVDIKVPENLQFYLVNEDGSKNYQTIDEVLGNVNGELSRSKGQTASYEIGWKWPFEGRDMLPEADGMYSFKIVVDAEQIDTF